MNSSRKICLVIHSLGIGGMERVMALLATNFARREEVQVDLILIGKNRHVAYSLPASVRIHKPDFEFNSKNRTRETLRTVRFLRNKIKNIEPDVVLSFGEHWNNLVLLSLYGLSIPVYVSDRSKPDKDLGRVQNFLRDVLYPTAAGYIAQTNVAKQVCQEHGWNNNIRVIGNPIREINGDSTQPPQDDNIVLSVGRLIRTKNFDQLIKTFHEIDPLGWKLVIVGGDAKKLTLSSELNNLIQELGAEDKIFLEGEQKNIDSYYRKSKVFAYMSSSEGFPNVIGEALSAGLPVVCYDCIAGPADMIKDEENGFLVPLFDQDTFKQRLEKLINCKKTREEFSKAGQESIKEYDPPVIAEKFYSFITSR